MKKYEIITITRPVHCANRNFPQKMKTYSAQVN